MAKFSNNSITDAGRALLAQVHTGGELDPVGIVLGSGYIPTGKTAATMTEVVSPVITLSLNKREKTPDGKVILGGYYSNKDVTTDFYFRELAVLARVRFKQDDGTYTYGDTVLYSYGNAGANADLMAAYGGSTVIERQMDVVIWIGNETAINLTVESNVYVTHAEMNKAISESEARLQEKIDDVSFRVNRDLFVIGERLDAIDDTLEAHRAELDALNENTLLVHSRLNEIAAQTSSVWDALFNDIVENPTIVDFDTLDGILLTGGVWNAPLRRLEV